MSSLKIWVRIPDLSTLELSLASDGAFVGGARLVTDEGEERLSTHEELSPGPARETLRTPRGYVVRVRVGFVDPATTTVTLHARVVKRDGSAHGEPYWLEVTGRSGQHARATILARTVQEEA